MRRAAEHADLTLSPAVRRAVLEHHVDPSKIHGTGKDGRITKDDVLLAAKAKDERRPVHEPEVQCRRRSQAAPQRQLRRLPPLAACTARAQGNARKNGSR